MDHEQKLDLEVACETNDATELELRHSAYGRFQVKA